MENAGDSVVENAEEGTDVVESSVSYTLGENVETLVLSGSRNIDATGNELDNSLLGNAGDNVLDGGAGNDTLEGAGGTDQLIGGEGDDQYIINAEGTTIFENEDEGTDVVTSSISYTLGDNVENLVLVGSEGIDGTGNLLNNEITGNSVNNVLDGGEGADQMSGLEGDDTYVVDDAGDVVTENAGEGIDTVQSTVSYTLGDNVENLVLTGEEAIDGTGNTLDNQIIGNAGANTLDGDAGADLLIGGEGDDTYIVENAGDSVVENAAEGIDTVVIGMSYTLGANVENLVLTGEEMLKGVGNSLDNSIVGNESDNVLDGGVGADVMEGGAGDDTYYIDDQGDVINEVADEGVDLAVVTTDYTLSENVENLTISGSEQVAGYGNAIGNVLVANDGGNSLDGVVNDNEEVGDTLVGGSGDDTLVVHSLNDVITGGEGTDVVVSEIDYTLGSDVENLTLVGTAESGMGNTFGNYITGNELDNTLNGQDGVDT
ncbi:calcium-binding protein, partial [bacterium]|nr:calcium-binding protein [bacterium]